ncbi:MAG: hypothetical protein HOP13_04460 [Alphaproteobacteria bacterium]|nr:hypothetical protein [Alphaproteobacteria bacterium]
MTFRLSAVLLFAVTAAVASATSPLPPPMRLIPIDEAVKDPSFVQFRNELKAVVARKDAAKLFHYLASDIHLSFGGDYGGPEFHKMWKPFDKDTKVWNVLSLIVDNGGKFVVPGGFAAPYAYAAFPEDFDAFTSVVVTNPRALLRERPNPNARVIRELDFDILEVVNSSGKMQHETGPNDWDEVKHASGQRGFVLSSDVRSPVEYRAIFEKRNGKWVMQTLIAGD